MNNTTDHQSIIISSLSKEGYGQAYIPKKKHPLQVVGALPDDNVIIKRAAYHSLYEIVSWQNKSVNHRELFCQHAKECGGCSIQHMQYQAQLEYKEKMIQLLFEPLLPSLEMKRVLHPIIACPSEKNYRNKMEYTFSQDLQGQKYLGLIKKASKGRVLNMTECHLTSKWFIDVKDATYKWWQSTDLSAFHLYKGTGTLRTLTVRESKTTGDKTVILTVSGNPDFAPKREQLNAFCAAILNVTEMQGDVRINIVLRIHQAKKGMATQFYEMTLYGPALFREHLYTLEKEEVQFELSPLSFYQPNGLQAQTIYDCALQFSNLNKETVLYDLYCGVGIFGILASYSVKNVIAIELSSDAAYDAKTNADRLKRNNFQVFKGDVGSILTAHASNLPKADVVIIDPPRAGLDATAEQQIIGLNPKRITYVSCNPVTQVQNIATFLKNGYEIEKIQPIDQFPQTLHVENICSLKRIS